MILNEVMTKKTKSKSKVSTSASDTNKEEKEATNSDCLKSEASPIPVINNGKLSMSPSTLPSSGYLRGPPSGKITNNSTGPAPSLASIPGIVDSFLAPKFKTVSLKESQSEKKSSTNGKDSKDKDKETDRNANKVDKKSSNSSEPLPEQSQKSSEKKSKKKKAKSVKDPNHVEQNAQVLYDSEDGANGKEVNGCTVGGGRGFDPNYNNGIDSNCQFPTSFQNHLMSELTPRNVQSLAQLERIRSTAKAASVSSAYKYEGNNIFLLRRLNFNYDADGASGGGPGSVSIPSDETSILGLDHDEDDDDEREGSWSLTHQVDYGYASSKQQASVASSSVASSESENNISSISTTASGSTLTSFTSSNKVYNYPALASCSSILDGANNPCEIKDCAKPTTKKCSQCKNAFYCGEDHQRFDWKKHKNECIPFRMNFENGTSIAVASRNIPQGETIFRDKPLLVLPIADPDNDFLNVMDLPCIKNRLKDVQPQEGEQDQETSCCKAVRPACFGCLKSTESNGLSRFNCSRCRLPLCSYKCHMDPFHQSAECQALQSLGGWTGDQHSCYHSMYMDIEIIRALQLGNFDTSTWDKFLSMNQNLRVEAYKGSKRYQRFLDNYKELVPISAKMSGFNDDLIGNVHAIISALSFKPSLKSPYKMLFSTQILFGHSCVPNTFHYLEESPNGVANRVTLVTKAADPIMKKQYIIIDFSPTPFLYYPLRRMILRNVLSIDCCNCERCRCPSAIHDRTSDIKCPSCEHGLVCPEKAFKWQNSVWACTSCLEELPYQAVVKITSECRDELANVLTGPRPSIVAHLQQFINRREKDLNPDHSIIIQAWSLIEAHLRPSLAATRLTGPAPRYPENTIEEYCTLKRSCDAIEKHLNVVRPGISYEKGCILANRYYIEIAFSAKKFHLRLISRKEYISEMMSNMKMLQEALKIFQMYEGFNRDVALHIQETTSALVTTKSFIQELLLSENEENRNKKMKSGNGAVNLAA